MNNAFDNIIKRCGGTLKDETNYEYKPIKKIKEKPSIKDKLLINYVYYYNKETEEKYFKFDINHVLNEVVTRVATDFSENQVIDFILNWEKTLYDVYPDKKNFDFNRFVIDLGGTGYCNEHGFHYCINDNYGELLISRTLDESLELFDIFSVKEIRIALKLKYSYQEVVAFIQGFIAAMNMMCVRNDYNK